MLRAAWTRGGESPRARSAGRGGVIGVIEFCLLGSGSSGNAVFVRASTGKFLIDNGLSLRQLQSRLDQLGETFGGLEAVVVTHEHRDHVNGIGVLARRTGVPVYLTRETEAALPDLGSIPQKRYFESGDTIRISDFELTSFSVTHDAADPVSFTVTRNGCRLGLAADLGSVSALVRERLRHCHALVLESNHCPDMLRRSSYPPAIVQRIRGRHGHLSNQEMNSLLADLLHPGLQCVVAVHVSRENNTEAKAREMAQRVLKGHPARLFVARQDEPTPLFRIETAAPAAIGRSA
jgi:phosphoribosyl 1,2-cyclic phosphodiesterase